MPQRLLGDDVDQPPAGVRRTRVESSARTLIPAASRSVTMELAGPKPSQTISSRLVYRLQLEQSLRPGASCRAASRCTSTCQWPSWFLPAAAIDVRRSGEMSKARQTGSCSTESACSQPAPLLGGDDQRLGAGGVGVVAYAEQLDGDGAPLERAYLGLEVLAEDADAVGGVRLPVGVLVVVRLLGDVVRVVVVERPLEVGQLLLAGHRPLADARPDQPFVVNFLVDRGAGVPDLRVRPRSQRRPQRAHHRLGQEHRLVEDEHVAGEPTAGGLRPRAELDVAAVRGLEPLVAVRADGPAVPHSRSAARACSRPATTRGRSASAR